ncbi:MULTISPECIES: ABC transporter permease [Pseudoxanthomonas]|jgi:phospholipid/cholesterol/gamma-HCH transport system permease protein|uniref:ABC transporter permease n=1 Tax=Pseudoxanthomonas winnipegensis TaxID=2480810 RepID=A0A4Q8LHJ9_9GAMM|nr:MULTISPECIES: ABC transporter permease [Pseudoxanthomonas]PZP60856.1 MAG: ABC transporter permease [Pseudoxanthomonas spadix]TAA28744.1 ABC transporter permease [Pseudoxanthomonas winnipegensis]TMN19281.1 ABC transporter permease [Pseudoxanthomonas sp. X-1]UAY74136.1 ABC transporter permease [Pseudoxanthomonas sp. X-1]
MTTPAPTQPEVRIDPAEPTRARLLGNWTLACALDVGRQLTAIPAEAQTLDATGVSRLDSAGVLALLRYASRNQLPLENLLFRQDHQALVSSIEDVVDDRPRKKRDYGFLAALARLGYQVQQNGRAIMSLVSFTGENLVKLMRIVHEPHRLRLTSTVHHMEQVGLDAVPLVALLSYLVGAVIAFLGSTILRDFGAQIYVVELVSIATLRELAPLMTAIVVAGRTASSFTAQIGAMKSREEVDAIRTLGLDPIDLLVIPRLLALLFTLPLLTFVAMMAGLAGGVTVGAFDLNIPPQMYLARLHDTIELRHMLVGLVKVPVFAMVIGLIGCLEGMQVQGTAQSVGERTTSSVVQTISLVIVIDAFAALWFMQVGW